MTKYDALIIGAGQSGVPLASDLAKEKGMKVAIAEAREIGGSCVNYGCTPTKTLVASARIAHHVRRSADYGIHSGDLTVDFAQVMARKDAIVERFRKGGTERLENSGVEIYRGHARFEAANRVRVNGDVIEADRIYINAGARSTPPKDLEGLDSAGFLDARSVLELKNLPDHLIILGAGYIGIEYSQIFRRLGSAVTVIAHGGKILAREDEDISRAAQGILEGEGIHMLFNAKAKRVERHGEQVIVTVVCDGQTQQISGTHLLVATGRKPNTDDLGLDAAGIATDDEGFITVDDHLQTNIPGVWSIGDVNGRGAFTHTSYNDYEIIIDNLNGGKRKVSDRILTYAVFIDPPLGRVGMNETEARESGHKVLMATMPMAKVSRAIEYDETQGLMKVLVDADSGLFLGAMILGLNGDEIIHVFTDLMYARAPYTVMRNAVHIHPTVSELLPTMLGQLQPLS